MSRMEGPVGVLVTGVGDTVGQAVIKAARRSAIPCRVVATDRAVPCVGFAWADAAYVLPHSSREAEYVAGIVRICGDEGVSLILPGTEGELVVLARHASAIRDATGASVVAGPPHVLEVALDKWRTCRFLEGAGLRFPRYARLDTTADVEMLVAAIGFPLIAKPIHGTGSRGVREVHSWADVRDLRSRADAWVLQELLGTPEEEFSVATYVPRAGVPVVAACYRREHIVAGDTYRAAVAPQPDVEAEAMRVVDALATRGPCDIQLRRTPSGPVTFEINPRFSGGTSIWARFGFNQVEMAVRDYVTGEAISPVAIGAGTAVRYWEEMYFDDGTDQAPLSRPGSTS